MGFSPLRRHQHKNRDIEPSKMASTNIIVTTVQQADQIKSFNMLSSSRKAQILQQMAAAVDAKLGLPAGTKHAMPDTDSAPRKRQRLTHLSTEEKMMRRKLKNRVAAQTARDRKKAQMDGLESSVGVMESRNKQLQRENARLTQQNQALLKENAELKQRLQGKQEEKPSLVVLDHGYCLDSPATPTSSHLTVKKEADVESPGPAALTAPPQQELARLFLAFLSMMLTWSLTTSFSGFSANSTRQPSAASYASSVPQRQDEPLCLVTRKNKRGNNTRQAWWGPQQQSWNPSKN